MNICDISKSNSQSPGYKVVYSSIRFKSRKNKVQNLPDYSRIMTMVLIYEGGCVMGKLEIGMPLLGHHFDLDRETVYNEVRYVIVDILPSNHLLVIPKGSEYPCTPLIIPGQ